MTFRNYTLSLFFSLFFGLSPLPGFAAGIDGEFRFSTVETEHFSIHYHQGLEKMASKTGYLAEVYHYYLTDLFKWTPREKTHIVLHDSSDFANGSAATLPYNIIRIRTVPPSIDSTLGEYDDWLKALLVHEYTHILTLDASRGYSKALRSLFGKPVPLFSDILSLAGVLTITPPNFFLPSWWKEGIATWAETEFTDAGRGRSSWFEMIYRTAVLQNVIPSIDEINGERPAWPSGKMPYIFGVALFDFIADRYGQKAPGELNFFHSGRYPYISVSLPEDLFQGKNYESLYQDMVAEMKSEQRRKIESIKKRAISDLDIFDTRGEFLVFPRVSPDGRYIAVTRRDPGSHKAIVLLNRDGTPSGISFDREFSSDSVSWSEDSERVYFSQARVVNGFNIYEDIFAYSLNRDEVTRITTGLRLKDPHVRPGSLENGQPVFCAVRSFRGEQNLVIAAFDIAEDRYVVKELTNLDQNRVANPRWSPDGRFIVYEARGSNRHGGIHIYEMESGADQVVYEGSFALSHPVWSKDGSFIVFVSDETGVFNLFAWHIEEKKLSQITNVTGGVFQPHISPEGDEIFFSSYHSAGMRIGKTSLVQERWWDVPGPVISKTWDDKNRDTRVKELINDALGSADTRFGGLSSPAPYSPLKSLLPRFWIPSYLEDHSGVGGGFFTAGNDAVGYHAYFVRAEYVPGSKTGYYDAVYRFDSLYPSFIINTSSLPVRYASFTGDDYYELNRSTTLRVVVPVNRIDSNYSFTFGYRFQEQSALSSLQNNRFQGLRVFQGTRDNIFVGAGFSNIEKYPYSVSYEKGRSLSFVSRFFSSKLRNGRDASEHLLSYSELLPAVRQNSVFQFTLRVAVSEGEQTAQHSFQLGGHGGESFFFLRGYPSRSFRGRYVATTSLEYRFPVRYIFRGSRTRPLFFDRIHGAIFVDSGEIWDKKNGFALSRVKTGSGIEMRFDMVLGYMQKVIPTIGFARGFNRGGDTRLYFYINYGMDL